MTKYLMFGSAIIIALMGLTIWYLKSDNDTLLQNIATLKADNQVLKSNIKELNKTVIKLENVRKADQKNIIDLSVKMSDYRSEANRLNEKFKKHDLNRLSIAKPKLIEKIINKGTKKVGKEFEELTK